MRQTIPWGALALLGLAIACGSSDEPATGGAAASGGSSAAGGGSAAGGTAATGGSAAGGTAAAGGDGSSGGSGATSGAAGGSTGGAGGTAGTGAAGAAGSGSLFCPDVPGGLVLRMASSFEPSEAEPTRTLSVPAGDGDVYSRIELDLDLYHGGWYVPVPDGAHGIFQLTRGARWASNLYGFMTLRGPAANNLIRIIANVDLAQGQVTRLQTNQRLTEYADYHLRYVYDTQAGVRTLTMTSAGQTVVDIQNCDTTSEIRTARPGFELILATALACDGCGPEVPTYGWRYSAVCMRVIP